MNQTVELSDRTGRVAWWWAGLALAWAVVSVVGHLPFSIWLVSQRSGASGPWAFKDAVPYVTVLAAVALCLWVWRQSRTASAARLRVVGLFWLVWLACCVMVDRWLTYTVNEYAHYPQFALLAWLWARALDGDRSRWPVLRVVLITALLGALDETLQYLWTTRSYSHYLDFNDWVVNVLAAWAGVMLFYGFANPPERRITRGPVRWRQLGLGLVLAWLLWAGVGLLGPTVQVTPASGVKVPAGGWVQDTLYLQRAPDWYAHWHPGPRHGRYWVLSPAQGLGLMLLGLLLARQFGKRPSRKLGSDPI